MLRILVRELLTPVHSALAECVALLLFQTLDKVWTASVFDAVIAVSMLIQRCFQ